MFPEIYPNTGIREASTFPFVQSLLRDLFGVVVDYCLCSVLIVSFGAKLAGGTLTGVVTARLAA